MIRHAFQYERPQTLPEAVALLREAGSEARVLGGGSMLVPFLSSGLDKARLILDPIRLNLDGVHGDAATVRIGARATYATLAASVEIRERLPLLAAMVAEVTGGAGLWNLATLGGAVCFANPSADGPGCLAALDARFRLASVAGERLASAKDFFLGAFSTCRRPDEILTEIVIPAETPMGSNSYRKLKNAASSWPIVTASAFTTRREDGVHIVRASLGAAAPAPLAGVWTFDDAPDIADASAMADALMAKMTTEWADELAGPGYRRAVAGTVLARVLRETVGMSA